jgi:hypothetical protein
MATWIYLFLRGVGVVSRGVYICLIAPWIRFFSDRVNSWLTDRKERTEFNLLIIESTRNKSFLAV